jgi:copper chaperone
VPDMMCGSCGKKIMAAVMEVDADAVVVANPETKQVEVTTVQSSTAIRVAIESVGFEVTL